MHFRCVYTLLLCCVLIGLDWAEPMMHLYLHVTCSCIFMYMYVPLSFYICYIVSCWCFSDCLSLSLPLSLFLTLVVSWHLNVNPFHPGTLFILGASSSSSPSDPTPSHIRFRDEKAKSDFSKNFS